MVQHEKSTVHTHARSDTFSTHTYTLHYAARTPLRATLPQAAVVWTRNACMRLPA